MTVTQRQGARPDRNEILHTSRQWNCRDVWKISLWSVEYVLIESTANLSLVGRAPSVHILQEIEVPMRLRT